MKWEDISTAPLDGEQVDLFGRVAYDQFELRLPDCEFRDGEWFYFVCGNMEPISRLGYTPTHWMRLVEPKEYQT